jgi:high-affinity nickel permease
VLTLLFTGFLIGLRHALDADHLAAVATIATRSLGIRDGLRQGLAWGIGHTITLFLFGAAVLLLDQVIPERLALGLELLVGVMLVYLGVDVLARLRRLRIHAHAHEHDGGVRHAHVHAHATEDHQAAEAHAHPHPHGVPRRALVVGLVHGMAGSAALILLTLANVESVWVGLLYILVFGVGSIAGMALVSLVIALPLHLTSVRLFVLHRGVHATIGLLTILLGGVIVWRAGFSGGLIATL